MMDSKRLVEKLRARPILYESNTKSYKNADISIFFMKNTKMMLQQRRRHRDPPFLSHE